MVVFQLSLFPLIIAQSEGDVRLMDGPSANVGRLEIFWKGKWSTFCGLSSGGAQAACRQLGYLGFISYKALDKVNPNLNISEAEQGTPIAIDYTKCEYSFSKGLLHVLRCGYSTQLSSDCSHANDIILQCQTTSLWTHPYEGQVRLTTRPPMATMSFGVLEISFNGKWGNVCGDDFNQAAADSACRQMGYTNALNYTTVTEKSGDVAWLHEMSCQGNNMKSCDCLSGCFGSNPTTPVTCPLDTYAVLTCTYNVNIEDKAPSGSRDICENKQSSCNGPLGPSGGGGNQKLLSGGALAGIVLTVVIVLAMVGFVVLVLVITMALPRWRKRAYASIN